MVGQAMEFVRVPLSRVVCLWKLTTKFLKYSNSYIYDSVWCILESYSFLFISLLK